MNAFDELMAIRNLGEPAQSVTVTGTDPVLSTRFKLGETVGQVLAALGVAVSDIWEHRTGRTQDVEIDVSHAAAALRSYQYMRVDDPAYQAAVVARTTRSMMGITRAHPTKDGRWFLPHMGLPHLGERVLNVLKCEATPTSVSAAIGQWDALELEDAIAEARGCGAVVRSTEEWLAHPHGEALARKPVVEIIKIADSDPEPLQGDPARPLTGVRVLDLTRILAGPTCARTMAEHGADVLMVTAEHLPQSTHFVMDTGHGKRSSFLDLNKPDEAGKLRDLVREADVFSQGYRTGALANRGFSPEQLAEIRPGIIYTSMNCYGYEGPFRDRAGWEQLAQTVTGILMENGDETPQLLPAAACDYTTGYLAAFGTLLALARRARDGGSYHVRASLCQSGMLINRQGLTDSAKLEIDIPDDKIAEILVESETPYGPMKHLGPVLRLSETTPYWSTPTVPLGTHEPAWLARS